MENQHKLIKGYRDLSAEEVDLINVVKQKGQDMNEFFDYLIETNLVDHRWWEIEKTDMQKSFMWLTRCIAKPGGF